MSQKKYLKNNDSMKIGQEGKVSKKDTRANIDYAMLTYKTFLDKKEYEVWIKEQLTIVQLYIAHEAPDHGDGGTPYEHTHVVLQCKRTKINPDRRLDYKGIHPNIRFISVTKLKPFQLAINYISDPKKNGGDPSCHQYYKETETSLARRIWKCKDVNEALETLMDKPSDASGIIQCFNMKNDKKEVSEFEHEKKKFQLALEDEIVNKKYNTNKLTWYNDHVGMSGKTSFAQWLWRKKQCALIMGAHSQKNIMCAIENAIKTGWDGKVVILNLSRANELSDTFYSTCELLMDGTFPSKKFLSLNMIFIVVLLRTLLLVLVLRL